MKTAKHVVLQHIQTLFRLARETIHGDPQLAQRYINIARKITMRTRIRLPKEYRRLICKHCESFILPGVNCRVRIQQRRESHVVITCFNCGKQIRIPLETGKK